MAEFLEEASGLESTTIGIYRTSSTVKGGRRFSFGALVVVGDRNGNVGLGYAKAPGVPAAIEKAQKYARKKMHRVLLQQTTIPHEVQGRFLASKVKLIPASPGTGVIAGGTVRAVLELAGVRDCLTKCVGSTNQKNVAKAALEGLGQFRTRQTVEALRGVDIVATVAEDKLKGGIGLMAAPVAAPTRPAKREKRDDKRGGGRRGGNNSGGKRPRRGEGDAAAANPGDSN